MDSQSIEKLLATSSACQSQSSPNQKCRQGKETMLARADCPRKGGTPRGSAERQQSEFAPVANWVTRRLGHFFARSKAKPSSIRDTH